MTASEIHSVKKAWHGYLSACHGDNKISDTQLHETKQAFYSGALTVMGMMMMIGELPQDQGCVEIDKIRKEVEGEIANQVIAMVEKRIAQKKEQQKRN